MAGVDQTQPLLELEGISKNFGPVQALNDVNFSLYANEVTALLGDNGAGKSTLIKIISGRHTPTSGRIRFNGADVRLNSPMDARGLGIETVYQDLALVETMSIARNFFLGSEPIRHIGPIRLLDSGKMETEARHALNEIGLRNLRAQPQDPVSVLSGGERQAIAIGRTMHFGAKLVILDEPTSSLSLNETKKVLNYMQQAKDQGLAVIFITHNIYHAYPAADHLIVLENGQVVEDCRKEERSLEEIADTIRGKEAAESLDDEESETVV